MGIPRCFIIIYHLFPQQPQIPQELLIREHNRRYNPKGAKRGAEEVHGEARSEEPESKRLCIDKTRDLTDESLMDDKTLGSLIFFGLLSFPPSNFPMIYFVRFLNVLPQIVALRVVLSSGAFKLIYDKKEEVLWTSPDKPGQPVDIAACTELFGFGSGDFALNTATWSI